MVDLSTRTIRQLFEEQVRGLTMRTLQLRDETSGIKNQYLGGWLL